MRDLVQMMEKIDFVITWVNDGDPEWQVERQLCKKKAGMDLVSSIDDCKERYRNWDNLHYWFRGVEIFAPWVNKIHFVTWGHLPSWLNTNHRKLHIVKHADYLPQEFQPTFNSHTLELNLHRIPDLSEQFVYFNDDMFLTKTVRPEDFFQNGKPCDMLALQPDVANPRDVIMPYIMLNNAMILAKYFDKRSNARKQPNAYFHIGYPLFYILYNLMEMTFPKFTGFYTVHGPSPLKKSTYNILWEEESELLSRTCCHHFRHKEDVNQYLLREFQKLSGDFVPTNLHRNFRYFNVNNENKLLLKCIRAQAVKEICINDNNFKGDFERVKTEINQAFQQILPQKSSFEL